ncbi:PP2C family protein-serine/threonine phosphatase [Devosia sp. CN2-171]|uniref:PP2C family protein-serine/threonine phosphatase n=1 Tax=Devosia sp. CN2-171 TaxID=3400909 RepID=UPI003BF8C521
MSHIETWGGAISGSRENQEDWHTVLPLDGDARVVIVVADGMGGHVAGETASRLAGEAFAAAIARPGQTTLADTFLTAITQANQALANAIEVDAKLDGMGTTLVGVVLTPEGMSWTSVGDSALLLVRQGVVSRLNADHSYGAHMDEQIRLGHVSPMEAPTSAERSQLMSAVAGDEIELVEIAANAVQFLPGDLVVAASDGLLTLDFSKLAAVVARLFASPLADIGAAILAAITDEHKPHQDNATVVLARVRYT